MAAPTRGTPTTTGAVRVRGAWAAGLPEKGGTYVVAVVCCFFDQGHNQSKMARLLVGEPSRITPVAQKNTAVRTFQESILSLRFARDCRLCRM